MLMNDRQKLNCNGAVVVWFAAFCITLTIFLADPFCRAVTFFNSKMYSEESAQTPRQVSILGAWKYSKGLELGLESANDDDTPCSTQQGQDGVGPDWDSLMPCTRRGTAASYSPFLSLTPKKGSAEPEREWGRARERRCPCLSGS